MCTMCDRENSSSIVRLHAVPKTLGILCVPAWPDHLLHPPQASWPRSSTSQLTAHPLDAVRLNWSATAQMDCMFAGDDADAACTLRSRRPISRPLPTRSAAERTPTCHSTDTSSAQLLGRRPSLRLPCDLLDSSADTSTYISLGG